MGRHCERYMTSVDHCNRLLADRLGLLPDGKSRFAWVKASEARYFLVRNGQLRIARWSERIGNVWVLCGWSEPTVYDPAAKKQTPINRATWAKQSGGVPYPTKGLWRAYPESACPAGTVPSERLTANYCAVIDLQLSRTFEDELVDIDVELKLDADQADNEWVEYVQNSAPAFQNFTPGSRSGSVSYGGV